MAERPRTAVVERAVAQAFALKDWITCRKPGRVASYEITAAGRAALKRMLDEEDAAGAGMAEAAERPLPTSTATGASAR